MFERNESIPGLVLFFLSNSMHFQDMLKENKVALEIDKYWTDNELGAFAEAVTKTRS